MIYILKSNEFIKIGKSKDPDRRFIQHKTSNPVLKLLEVYDVDDSFEKMLHEHLSNFHYSHEWFYYYPNVLDDIEDFIKANGGSICKPLNELQIFNIQFDNINSKEIVCFEGKAYSKEDFCKLKEILNFKKYIDIKMNQGDCIVGDSFRGKIYTINRGCARELHDVISREKNEKQISSSYLFNE